MIKRIINNRLGYIYVIWTPAYPYAFKLGISVNPKLRRAQIEEELHQKMFLKAPVYLLLTVPSLFRERNEALLHRWLNPFRACVVRHSGYTEWFYSFAPNAIIGALLYILSSDGFSYGKLVLFSIIAFAPFPIGAILALIVVSIAEILILTSAIVLVLAVVLSIAKCL